MAPNPTFRVYALIHGPILPEGDLFGFEVRVMNGEEQESRGFSPVQGVISDDTPGDYKTYVTSLPFVDPVKIKSNHVVITTIEERDEKAALGGAVRKLDRLCRYLSLANLRDFRTKHSGNPGGFLPYIFQVNRIYRISAEGKEEPVAVNIRNGHIYLPDRPESDKWRVDETGRYLHELYSFHDDVLERALKYLYRSSIGPLILDSPEKVALDHFKSIEVVINSMSRKNCFTDRVDEVGAILGLTQAEKDDVNKFWKSRSEHGDVAHPSAYDQAERYPNQFPIPSNVEYPWAYMGHAAADVILKYFQHRKNTYLVDVGEPWPYISDDGYQMDSEGRMAVVNPQWESNHFAYDSKERNKDLLKRKVVTAFSVVMGIPETDISAELGLASRFGRTVILRVKRP